MAHSTQHQRKSATPDELSAPAYPSIGRFVIRELLGEGAHGQVYLAHDPLMDRLVALKLAHLAHDDPTRRERFQREAKAAARLRHPNLVAVYESGESNGRLYTVSEYVEGEPLSQVVTEARARGTPTLAASAAK